MRGRRSPRPRRRTGWPTRPPTAAHERLDALAAEAERLQARDRSLRSSPEMRSAEELARLADEARRRRADAEVAARQARDAAETVASRRGRHERAVARARGAADELGALRDGATDAAGDARLGPEHAGRIDAQLNERALPHVRPRD